MERFITPITAGRAKANMRFTRRPVFVSCALASAKRRCSRLVRTKARITRTPVICSRNTRLTRSILAWIVRNKGTALKNRIVMMPSRTGTATTSSARELDVLFEGHDHPADAHDGCEHHHGEGHLQEQLDLLHVVGVAGDERRRPEVVRLLGREALHGAEYRCANVTADAHRDSGGEIGCHHGHQCDDEGDGEHVGTCRPDVVDVAFFDAVVDDVSSEIGQVKVRHRLDHEKAHDQADLAPSSDRCNA